MRAAEPRLFIYTYMNTSNKVSVMMGAAAVVATLFAGIVLRDLAAPSAARLMDARLLVAVFAALAVFGITTVSYFLRRQIDQNRELKEAQEALSRSLAALANEKRGAELIAQDLRKFQLAVEHSLEHIVITDPDGRIVYANAAVAAITGFSHAEILGATPALWGKQMDDTFYHALWAAIKKDKREFFGEMTNRRKNGELYRVEAYIYPLRNPDGNAMFFVGIERDITERKKLEDTRSNFISIASHQLRTPISAMRWIAEALVGGDAGPLTPQQADLANDLHRSTKRLGDLVRGLLNIVRIESAELAVYAEPVDPRALCEALIEEHAPRAREKRIELSYAGVAPIVRTDPRILREIVKNFLDNAIRYTPAGGRIALSLGIENGMLVIEVKDTGMGIPKAQQERIFTKFFRADNALRHAADGSGLGLYIARSLAGFLGGEARFVSEEGVGTSFFIAVPLAQSRERRGKELLFSE